MTGQRLWGALGDDLAVVDDDHVVGEPFRLVHEVGGEQDAHSVALERGDDVPHRHPRLGVQARGGLVQEDQFRPADQCQRQRQALLLAAREAPVGGLGRALEADQLHEPPRVVGVFVVAGGEVEHLFDGDAGVGAAALEHDADAVAHLLRLRDRVDAEHSDRPGGGLSEALAHLDGGGFAGAVGAQKRQQLAAPRCEREPVNRRFLAEALDNTVDDQRVITHG